MRRSPGHTTTSATTVATAHSTSPATTKPSPDAKAPWLAEIRAKPKTGTPYRARAAQLIPGRKKRRTPSAPGAADPAGPGGPGPRSRPGPRNRPRRTGRGAGAGCCRRRRSARRGHGRASTGRPEVTRAIVAARPVARRQEPGRAGPPRSVDILGPHHPPPVVRTTPGQQPGEPVPRLRPRGREHNERTSDRSSLQPGSVEVCTCGRW